MNLRSLERRTDPRTQSFVPITLFVEGKQQETPAHLLDLSIGGAAILTTDDNAPQIGHHLNVMFETPNNDGGTEGRRRRETGIVVNASAPERGITRVGVRFFHRPDTDLGHCGPTDLLSDHRRMTDLRKPGRPWRTAKNFRTYAR